MNDSFGRDKVALSQMKPSHQGHTGRERGRGEERDCCVYGGRQIYKRPRPSNYTHVLL